MVISSKVKIRNHHRVDHLDLDPLDIEFPLLDKEFPPLDRELLPVYREKPPGLCIMLDHSFSNPEMMVHLFDLNANLD
ncbi:hypothetical protein QVD99_000110 [Batrachochytrium dendrobatidis]|nr:hypothetical protein QVD99_000110 [Batrachochytrium dendrobatidis]